MEGTRERYVLPDLGGQAGVRVELLLEIELDQGLCRICCDNMSNMVWAGSARHRSESPGFIYTELSFRYPAADAKQTVLKHGEHSVGVRPACHLKRKSCVIK